MWLSWGLAARHQRPPVHPQDLDAAEAPPEPLALERLEGQRHDAAAPGLVDVQPGPAGPQQPQRQLGVLGDAPLVPAAQLRPARPGGSAPSCRRRSPRRARCATAGRRRRSTCRSSTAAGSSGAAPSRGSPAATGRTRASGRRTAARSGAGTRVELVVGVDHADELGPRVGQLAQRVVQRPGLVAGPVLQVRELDPVPGAPLLDRAPQALVVGVVVDHDDLVARVVEPQQRRGASR